MAGVERTEGGGERQNVNVMWRCRLLLLYLLLAGTAAAQGDVQNCGSLENAFGPFDYTDPANRAPQQDGGMSRLELVESYHFTSDVERLVRGKSSTNPVDDLRYTLHAFPNHHRALNAMANYQLRYKPKKVGGLSIDCWFERAMRFRIDDPIVRLVYGVYLAKAERNEEALAQYTAALSYAPNLAEAHYNIGLLYTDLKQYEQAYQHAVRAYELGFPLPGLRERLTRAGAWKQND